MGISTHSLPRRIAIVTGDPSLPDPTKHGHRYGAEDLAVHERMREAFAALGKFEFTVIERHEGLFDALRKFAPDLVVNFCDTGLLNNPQHEIHIATQLETMGLPYTGAAPRGMLYCYDKQIVRLLAEAMGVAVPRERFAGADASTGTSVGSFPALIKPNTADGSVGITKECGRRKWAENGARRTWPGSLPKLPGRDVLIQEYLPGAEYGLALIGNPDGGFEQLPMLEVDFSALPKEFAPILSFESKTDPGLAILDRYSDLNPRLCPASGSGNWAITAACCSPASVCEITGASTSALRRTERSN